MKGMKIVNRLLTHEELDGSVFKYPGWRDEALDLYGRWKTARAAVSIAV